MLNFVGKRYTEVGRRVEVIELVLAIIAILACTIAMPLILRGATGFFAQNNQYFIGPIVNCALILTAINGRGWFRTLTVIFLPSVASITTGLLFSLGTVYAMYMIPFIWLGNAFLVFLGKFLFVHKKWNYALSFAIAIAVKVAFIFGGFGILLAVNAIPSGSLVAGVMMTAMSLTQVITATLGACLAFGIIKLFYKRPATIVAS